MANSLTFNGTDLSTYNLIVANSELPVSQETSITPLYDKGFAGRSSLTAKEIALGIDVTGTSWANLLSNLDNIKRVLNTRDTVNLILDILNDRYWRVRFKSLAGKFMGPGLWKGNLDFIVPDPLAIDLNLVESNYSIDADPKTVTETPGGTANIEPVYTLTAGEALNDVTIKVENTDTEEELQWEGSLTNGQELEIDVALWIVTKAGSASMSTVSGQFPRLLPAVNNAIKVTGFGTSGSLDIVYRNRYL